MDYFLKIVLTNCLSFHHDIEYVALNDNVLFCTLHVNLWHLFITAELRNKDNYFWLGEIIIRRDAEILFQIGSRKLKLPQFFLYYNWRFFKLFKILFKNSLENGTVTPPWQSRLARFFFRTYIYKTDYIHTRSG